MARSLEQVYRDMAGNQTLLIAQLTAQLEAAQERIAQLEAELAKRIVTPTSSP